MSLTRLPNELACQIIGYLVPDDYESLMLSCKRLFEAGSDLLKRHNELRKRYRHFKYDDGLICSLQLLHRIAENPIIADYIKTADFLDDSIAVPGFLGYISGGWNRFLGDDYAVDKIEATLTEPRIPTHVNVNTSKWIKTITECRWPHELPIFATTVILSLLSNIQAIVLPKQWCGFAPARGNTIDDECCLQWKAMEGVLRESTNENNESRPLSKLTHIKPFHFSGSDTPMALQILSPFLALPSLKEFAASNCIAHRAIYSGKPFKWRYPSQICTVERIELASCCVDGELANLLKHTPYLRSFKLSYESKWFGCGSSWDAYGLIEALRSHCCETLEELSLTIDNVAEAVKGGLVSLREFAQLKHLELDVRIFFGPPPVTKELQEMDPYAYRNHAYASLSWNGTAVPCLADILAPCIKSVRLIGGFCREDILIVKSLLARLGGRAADCLPHLDTLVVSRATSTIGTQPIATGQSEVAWKSVADLVKLEGPYQFENVEHVRASWHEAFYRDAPQGSFLNNSDTNAGLR